MSDGKVTIETDLDQSGAVNGMGKMGNKLSSMGSGIASGIGSIFKGTAVAIGAVGTAIVGLGASAVSYNADMEQYATSFEVMTGSAEKSKEIMTELKQLGAATPFEFTDLAKATQTLMAFGFSADDAVSQFKVLGDISQGDAGKLDTFTQALGKMNSSGKVQLDTLNMMIDQGFNPLNIISQKTGKSMTELYDDVSKGKISVDQIKDAMVTATSEGGQFYQSMDKQSQTLKGRLSTLKDNFQQLTGAIFEGATADTGNIISLATDWVAQLQTAFETGGIDQLSSTIGTVLSQAIGMAVQALPGLADLATNLIVNFVNSLSQTASTVDFGTIISTIVISMAKIGESFVFLGISIIDSIISGMQNSGGSVLSGISYFIDTVLEDIAVFAPDLLNSGIQMILSFVNGMSSGFSAGVPDLLTRVIDIVSSLATVILNNLPQIVDTGIQLITSLATGLIDALPTLIQKAPDIILGLINAFVDAAPKIGEAAIKLIFYLAKTLVESIPDLVVAVAKIIVGLVNAFGTLAEKFGDVGKNIVDGLWKGISDGWKWLISKISGLAADLLAAVCKILDIHSPSKEFEWIGQMTAKGMENGFVDNDPTKAIKDMVVGNVSSLKTSMSGYVNGSISGTSGLTGAIVDAIANSNMTVKIGNKEFGRLVRGYA